MPMLLERSRTFLFFVPVRVCVMCAMFSPHPLAGANQAAFGRFGIVPASFDLHTALRKNHAHHAHHAQAQPSPVIAIDSEVFFVRDVCAMARFVRDTLRRGPKLCAMPCGSVRDTRIYHAQKPPLERSRTIRDDGAEIIRERTWPTTTPPPWCPLTRCPMASCSVNGPLKIQWAAPRRLRSCGSLRPAGLNLNAFVKLVFQSPVRSFRAACSKQSTSCFVNSKADGASPASRLSTAPLNNHHQRRKSCRQLKLSCTTNTSMWIVCFSGSKLPNLPLPLACH